MKSWQNWAIFLSGMAVLLFGTGNYWSATWLSKWALIMGLSSAAISFWAARKTSLFYLPLMLYASWSLIAIAVWPAQPYKELFDPVTTLATQKNALYGLVVWIITLLSFASITKKHGQAVIALLTSIWTLGILGFLSLPSAGIHSPPSNGLWFGNPSMAGSLLACLLPFVWSFGNAQHGWKHQKIFVLTTWLLTLLAIYRTNASIPWGVLGVVTSAVIAARSLRSIRSLPWILMSIASIAVLLLVLGNSLLGKDFFDQNGRFEIWKMAWGFFWEHANPALGFGFATSQVLLPVEQVMTGHYYGDYFLWLHNDWLQLALEGGYVGMTFIFLALARLLTVSWQRPALFAGILGFVVMGLFNYPLRMPIHSMCLLVICGMAEAYALRRTVRWSESERHSQKSTAGKSRLVPLAAKDLAISRSYNQFPGPNKN